MINVRRFVTTALTMAVVSIAALFATGATAQAAPKVWIACSYTGDLPATDTVNADGVRIRASYPSGAVRGLAYSGDRFYVTNTTGDGGCYGTDTRTGVSGWIYVLYLNLG